MNGVHCPKSGTLVPDDATDGNGVLRRPCDCGTVVSTDEGPTGLRAIERHRPRTIAGQLGTAEHLLARVAEAMAPAPGGLLVRVTLPNHTAERIKAFVDDRHAEMYRRMVDDNESLPIDGGPF